MSQFSFLQPEFADIYEHANRAEALALADPRGACFYARLALEVTVKWMYTHDGTLRKPYDNNLAALLHEPTFQALVGPALLAKTKVIKHLGNVAVHDPRAVAPEKAVDAVRELFHLAYWLVRTYAQGPKPDATLAFSADALPRTTRIEVDTFAKMQEVVRRYEQAQQARAAAEQERLKSEEGRKQLEAEIAQLQQQIAAIKRANQATPDTHDYNEAATRHLFIDLLLREAGWQIDPQRDTEVPVTGMPNATGAGRVDYVLWGDDGLPLALIEAKRTQRDARVGQHQAQLYADALERQFGRRPIIFYSNGYEHWLWDDQRYPPRPVHGFLKQDELELAIQRRATLKPLGAESINPEIVERYYQTRAIRRVGEAFEQDKLRKALLVMATGSGKTRTVIALSDLLMRANWARRILFLADRVTLVNQAVNAFKRFLPQASPVNLVTEKSAHGRVYVSTYPTMINLIDEMHNGVRRFGPGHFDLIVIDEAHRSIYRKYRAIFDYFDSLLVGLTATPRDEVDRDTYELFDLERGVPTDAYDLEDAVSDGFLVPPRAVSVPLKFQREGIKYDELSADEQEAWDAIEWDEEDGTVPEQIGAGALNRWLFNQDTVDKVLEHLMVHGLKVAAGDRLGKTIIFAKNHTHALYIAERFDANYPQYRSTFAQVIDHQTDYAQSLIDNFSTPENPPHIAISVDMLDTGIDIPEVVNLVFFKLVRSKTKFWQMIGRGTRLRPDLFGPGQHKEFFYVFDFCQNFEFFNQDPVIADSRVSPSLSQRLFTTRVELLGAIDAQADAAENAALLELRGEVANRLRDEVAGMNPDNFLVRPKRRLVEKYHQAETWGKILREERAELNQYVAGLPSALDDNDTDAKQFDLLVLNAQLSLLQHDRSFKRHQERMRATAGLLEELSNVPMVAAEMELILELQTDSYWQDVTAPMLERVRRRLRSLVKLIDARQRPIIYTNFEDAIGPGTEVALQGIPVGADMARFRMKVRHFLKDHMQHIAIQKLRRNEALTAQDLAELERIFREAGVAEAEGLEQVRREGGVGLFVRSLVGLDREAAKQAFAGFIAAHNPRADQIEFLNLIIDSLTEQGVMDPARLYESPFTDADPLGVEGIFKDAQVIELIGILNDVRTRAVA
jgi:type I restriction enzyme R subunit